MSNIDVTLQKNNIDVEITVPTKTVDIAISGVRGATGAKGDTGSQGIQGIQGQKGDKGDTGAAGSDATIKEQRYYRPYHWSIATTSATYTAARVYMELIEIPKAIKVDAIIISNAATISGNVRVGIYGPVPLTTDTVNGASLVVESSSTAQSGANVGQAITFTETTLQAGKYYLAFQIDNITGTVNRHGNVTQVSNWTMYYERSGGYGALTNPCPTPVASASNFPAITLRCSGTP